ncbi:MAG: hypothetical protein ACRDK2_03925 [Solirubrobacteraceae bacterium]
MSGDHVLTHKFHLPLKSPLLKATGDPLAPAADEHVAAERQA